MPKLRITIEKGQVKHDVEGSVGPECRNISQPYVDALGVPPAMVREEIKPEMHQSQSLDQQQ